MTDEEHEAEFGRRMAGFALTPVETYADVTPEEHLRVARALFKQWPDEAFGRPFRDVWGSTLYRVWKEKP